MMHDGWKPLPAISGGCQCGAVRFAVRAGPGKASVCHCRMCQRATGNDFAPLIEVPSDRATLTGRVTLFASSSLAERGFCATCGTPLFYRGTARDTVEFMLGAVDAPWPYDPVANHGVESRMPWLVRLNTLPDRETFLDDGEVLISHQSPEGR